MADQRVPSEILEGLMNDAGVGPVVKRKLRKANEPAKQTRGTGAPAQKTSIALDI